ncbi:hypothetical protein GW17_00020659, partial [Ensete ventricosum]
RRFFSPRKEKKCHPVWGEGTRQHRQLPDGTTKNRPSAIDFGCRRSIEGESTVGGRLREIGEKGKKKKRRRNRTTTVAACRSPVPRHRPQVARALWVQAIFLPGEETKRLPTWGER